MYHDIKVSLSTYYDFKNLIDIIHLSNHLVILFEYEKWSI